MFRLPPDYKNQAQVIINKGIQNLSIKKVGMITSTDHDSRIFANEIVTGLQKEFKVPAFHFQVAKSNVNFKDITQRITSFAVEGIIIHLDEDQLLDLLGQLQISGTQLPVFLPWIPGILPEKLKTYYRGDLFYLAPFSETDNPDFRTFSQKYFQLYREDPTPAAAYTYDAVCILIRCLKQSGLNKTALREAIVKINNYQGVTGKISWDNGGGNQAGGMLRFLFHAGGQISSKIR
jgi:branched-chain amino acid transport system substrate-binding protein